MKTKRKIKSFLVIVNYYRRFIPKFANTNINDSKYIEYFERWKQLLTSEPILAYPGLNKPLELITDASNFEIRVVVEQQKIPIAYTSRAKMIANKTTAKYIGNF